jgi:hypothetical protein
MHRIRQGTAFVGSVIGLCCGFLCAIGLGMIHTQHLTSEVFIRFTLCTIVWSFTVGWLESRSTR